MFARVLSSGAASDVVGYVTREFHDKKEYTPDTWRIIDSERVLTSDYHHMVQSFEAQHGFMPEKENPAGHIAISFDTTDAPRLTDEFMVILAHEYMEGMGIVNTQYIIVRHNETGHPHFHIVYNRVNNDGKAINERNNFKRGDRVVKAIKKKHGLTWSPLKAKYEERIPEFKTKIRAAIYNCRSWDEFSRRMAYAGIEVKFHDDRETGKHLGVKFSDGDITVNGSKIDRAFSFRRLNNLFESNRKQLGNQQSAPVSQPRVRFEYTQSHRHERESEGQTMLESIGESAGGLFKLGPGFDAEEEAFKREMDRQEAKRKRKSKGRKI